MGRADSVLQSVHKEFSQFFLVFTFEDEQILYGKLLILTPPEPQAVNIGRDIFIIQRGRVQKVKYFLVIDL